MSNEAVFYFLLFPEDKKFIKTGIKKDPFIDILRKLFGSKPNKRNIREAYRHPVIMALYFVRTDIS